MIVNSPVYGESISLRVAFQYMGTWLEVLADSTLLTIERGGSPAVAGGSSVDVGTLSISLLDVYDPSQVAILSPNRTIVAYVDDISVFPNPKVDGAIFTGTIQDIATDYFFDNGTKHVNVVITAVDAVSVHTGITVTNTDGYEGFTGTNRTVTVNPTVTVAANGYQRWEDRINEISTQFAKTTVPTVIVSSPVPIYNI